MVDRHAPLCHLLRAALAWLGAVVLCLAGPAQAAAPDADKALAPACHAYANSPADLQRLSAGAGGWICGDRDWDARSRHSLMRFDLGPAGKVPSQLSTRLLRFETVSLSIERADGTLTRYAYSSLDFAPRGQMRMALDLPEAGTAARRITFDFTGATSASLLSDARLHTPALAILGQDQVWIAMICGLLLMPLFFNLVLFRVLHDRFLLWHSGAVCCWLIHSLMSSGLAPLLPEIPVGTIALLIILSFSGGVGCSLMMAYHFIEPDMLEKGHRRALRMAAMVLAFNAAFYLATIDWLQGQAHRIYMANWLPVALVAVWTIGVALRRGSRGAMFLMASWVPLILTGLWQIAVGVLGDQTEPISLFVIQRLAVGMEVLIATVGIADRLIQLRRDRDDTLVRASQLALLAERDPLTGLLNRRAIEARFEALRLEGFATLALLDIDEFKAINDQYGHTVGDHVLQAVGSALPDGKDVVSVRMGGEEFLLLLRGNDASVRAERARQAITARIAREIPGLDRPITASMGLVQTPVELVGEVTFAAIYAKADGLLYQAKRGGKNRMVSERMQIFSRPQAGKTGTEVA